MHIYTHVYIHIYTYEHAHVHMNMYLRIRVVSPTHLSAACVSIHMGTCLQIGSYGLGSQVLFSLGPVEII